MKTLIKYGSVMVLLILTFPTYSQQLPGFRFAQALGNETTDIQVDEYGQVYSVSFFSGVTIPDYPDSNWIRTSPWPKSDILITKQDALGDILWIKQIKNLRGGFVGGSSIISPDAAFNRKLLHIGLDKAGDIFMVGAFTGQVDFDPGQGTHLVSTGINSYKAFVAKYTSDGGFLWVKTLDRPSSSPNPNMAIMVRNFKVDADGNLYLLGTFGGTLDFDPGQTTHNVTTPNTSPFHPFLLKLDNDGNFQWVRTYGNSLDANLGSYGLVLSKKNEGVLQKVYIAVEFHFQTVDLATIPNSHFYISPDSGNFFVVKYDADGNFIWGVTLGIQPMAILCNDYDLP